MSENRARNNDFSDISVLSRGRRISKVFNIQPIFITIILNVGELICIIVGFPNDIKLNLYLNRDKYVDIMSTE